MQPCFHNGPSKGVNERKLLIEEKKFLADVRILLFEPILDLNYSKSGVREGLQC